MNILIICYYFYPNNRIASFRLESFAKYFQQAGHKVTVIAEGDHDETRNWNGCEVHYIKNPVLPDSKLKELVKRQKRWQIRRVLNALENRIFMHEICWRFRTAKKVKSLFLKEQFDVILSTCGPMAPHHVALNLRKKGYKFFWIADIRDEITKHPYQRKSTARRLKSIEYKILKNADLVTSVSKPIIDDFKTICPHDRYLEIKNGYDYEEYHGVNFQPKFTMAYTGNFEYYITPKKWFKAFVELIKEGRIPSDSLIKIVGSRVYNRADYNEDEIKRNVIRIPEVPHDEAIRISTTETDVLVMMHPSGRKGVYSGKVFDYLASNKPILALYDPNDVVGGLLAETKAGFTVDESDHEGIKEAIVKCYNIWKNRIVLNRDWDKIRQYSRRNQARILLDYLQHNLSAQHSDPVPPILF